MGRGWLTWKWWRGWWEAGAELRKKAAMAAELAARASRSSAPPLGRKSGAPGSGSGGFRGPASRGGVREARSTGAAPPPAASAASNSCFFLQPKGG